MGKYRWEASRKLTALRWLADRVAVADLHALGSPGRSGGVNHVSKLLLRRRHRWPVSRIAQQRLVVIDEHHPRRSARHIIAQRPRRNDDRRCGILDDVLQAADGIAGIERHIRSAGFQNSQQGDDHTLVAIEQNADEGFRTDAQRDQMVRQFNAIRWCANWFERCSSSA